MNYSSDYSDGYQAVRKNLNNFPGLDREQKEKNGAQYKLVEWFGDKNNLDCCTEVIKERALAGIRVLRVKITANKSMFI